MSTRLTIHRFCVSLCGLAIVAAAGCVSIDRPSPLAVEATPPVNFNEITEWTPGPHDELMAALPESVDLVYRSNHSDEPSEYDSRILLVQFGETRVQGNALVRDVLPLGDDELKKPVLKPAPDSIAAVTPLLVRDKTSGSLQGRDATRYAQDEIVAPRRGEGSKGFDLPEIPYRVFSIYEPERVTEGVVLHMPGLAATQYDSSVRDEMLERGWLVIQAQAWSSFNSNVRLAIKAGGQVESAAEIVAESVDEILSRLSAEWEAVLADTLARRPELEGKPIALMGYSAGAISGVTVASRLRDQIDAAVFVGGGTNIAAISNDSSFASMIELYMLSPDVGGRVTIGEADALLLKQVAMRYAEISRLDPKRTARSIAHLPLLVIHGERDTWVPAETGEDLWARLERPERWTLPFDHDYLFWRLPSLSGKIADWVEDAVR